MRMSKQEINDWINKTDDTTYSEDRDTDIRNFKLGLGHDHQIIELRQTVINFKNELIEHLEAGNIEDIEKAKYMLCIDTCFAVELLDIIMEKGII